MLIPIEEVTNLYEFDMFVRKAEDVNVVEKREQDEVKAEYTGYWEALAEDDTVDMSVFFTGLV